MRGSRRPNAEFMGEILSRTAVVVMHEVCVRKGGAWGVLRKGPLKKFCAGCQRHCEPEVGWLPAGDLFI